MDTDDAHAAVLRLARTEGLLVGPSAGANLVAAVRLAERLQADGRDDAVVVTIFCDSAAKYLNDRWWAEVPVHHEAENWP